MASQLENKMKNSNDSAGMRSSGMAASTTQITAAALNGENIAWRRSMQRIWRRNGGGVMAGGEISWGGENNGIGIGVKMAPRHQRHR
jgi:hypothetical protein